MAIIIKSLSDIFYDQVDPRRRQEISDARMIQEDHNAMANLSPRFIHKQYNQNRFKYHQNSAPDPFKYKPSQVSAIPPRGPFPEHETEGEY